MIVKYKWWWIGLAIAAVLIVSFVVPFLTDDTGTFWQGMLGLAMLVAMGALYLVPSIVALVRKHRSTGGIVALNVLAGWTFIGWLVALVWSLSATQPQQVVVQQFVTTPQYQVGDVVNGHRFNGQTWEPVQ